jgi:hypothetical protein
MNRIVEIILITLTLGLSLILSYFQLNKLEGTSYLLISVYAAMTLLSAYYLFGLKNRYGLIVQSLMIIGLISTIFSLQFWPGGFLTSLINISMIACSIFCISSNEIRKCPDQEKYLLYTICVSLFIYGAFTLSNIGLIYRIGMYFNYAIFVLTLIYLVIRKNKSFVFDRNLKTFLIFSTISMISYLRYLFEK